MAIQTPESLSVLVVCLLRLFSLVAPFKLSCLMFSWLLQGCVVLVMNWPGSLEVSGEFYLYIVFQGFTYDLWQGMRIHCRLANNDVRVLEV